MIGPDDSKEYAVQLTTTQIGALAENLVANELMIESKGRLSPFQPVADDDGIDLLIYDKRTGRSCPIQIKARTNTINKRGKQERSNTAHFEIRKSTFNDSRNTMLLCVLLSKDLRSTERAWLVPFSELKVLTRQSPSKYVIRANKLLSSKDKYSPYQCRSINEVVERMFAQFDSDT
jgi:hypothetical protein